jgi:hypothetical protein
MPELQLLSKHTALKLAGLILPGYCCCYCCCCCCRDVAEAKQARRQQLASALTNWWLTTQRKAFDTWRDSVREAVVTRHVSCTPDLVALAP